MYTIKNLTHKTIKLTDDLSVAPGNSVPFNSELTPSIANLKKMGLISVIAASAPSVLKASKQPPDMKALRSKFNAKVAEAKAAKLKATKEQKTTKTKSSN